MVMLPICASLFFLIVCSFSEFCCTRDIRSETLLLLCRFVKILVMLRGTLEVCQWVVRFSCAPLCLAWLLNGRFSPLYCTVISFLVMKSGYPRIWKNGCEIPIWTLLCITFPKNWARLIKWAAEDSALEMAQEEKESQASAQIRIPFRPYG
jgi:hypothetical protein